MRVVTIARSRDLDARPPAAQPLRHRRRRRSSRDDRAARNADDCAPRVSDVRVVVVVVVVYFICFRSRCSTVLYGIIILFYSFVRARVCRPRIFWRSSRSVFYDFFYYFFRSVHYRKFSSVARGLGEKTKNYVSTIRRRFFFRFTRFFISLSPALRRSPPPGEMRFGCGPSPRSRPQRDEITAAPRSSDVSIAGESRGNPGEKFLFFFVTVNFRVTFDALGVLLASRAR